MSTKQINDAIQQFQPEQHYEPGDIIKILELMKAMNDNIAEIEAQAPLRVPHYHPAQPR